MSTSNEIVDYLNRATTVIVLIICIITFIPGIIGLLLNLVIFSQPIQRREPCSLYFLASSYFNLFVIVINLPIRALASCFDIDISDYHIYLCKTTTFTFYVTRVISCWLITFACIDRYFHSSIHIHIRRLSSVKIAKLTIVITSIVIFLSYSHMIVYYQITFGIDMMPACNAPKGIYRTFSAFWHLTMYSLCPSFLMFLFGCLTLRNIHINHRRIIPIARENHRMTRRTDCQLLRMLGAQVLMIMISTAPFSIYRLYASFTSNIVKSTIQITEENLINQIVNTIPYFAHSSSFYLYTLMGSRFRRDVIQIFARCSIFLKEKRMLRTTCCN